MNKKNKTRLERMRFRRNVVSGIAWIVLCIVIASGAYHLAEYVAPTASAAVCVEG